MREFFETLTARAEWPRWPASTYDVTAKECGCLVIREDFDPSYYWYRPMRWWMESFLGSGVEEPEPVSRIHWPLALMFAVNKDTVLRHSRSYYTAMHRLARQGINLLHDIKVGPGSLGDGFEMVYNPDTFGHALERLPFLLLANRSADAPKPYSLCRPRCSSEAGRVVSPQQLTIIQRKLNALNRRKVFPANAPLPNKEENLVLIRATNATRPSRPSIWSQAVSQAGLPEFGARFRRKIYSVEAPAARTATFATAERQQ